METKSKVLYGHAVCPKCYYGFANRRQLAFFLDVVFLRIFAVAFAMATGFALALIGIQVAGEAEGSPAQIVLGLFYTLVVYGLFVAKDGFGGSSFGKTICGVKVLKVTDGKSANFLDSIKRNLLLLIPVLPIVIAFDLCKGTRLFDKAAGTKVVWKKYAEKPVFAQMENGPIAEKKSPAGVIAIILVILLAVFVVVPNIMRS